MLTIKANHPVRKALGEIKQNYWASRSDAISTIGTVLGEHRIELTWPTYDELRGNEGRVNCALNREVMAHVTCDKCGGEPEDTEYNNWLVFTWYYLGDCADGSKGRWECCFYVS